MPRGPKGEKRPYCSSFGALRLKLVSVCICANSMNGVRGSQRRRAHHDLPARGKSHPITCWYGSRRNLWPGGGGGMGGMGGMDHMGSHNRRLERI